jgi:hypothetical protein
MLKMSKAVQSKRIHPPSASTYTQLDKRKHIYGPNRFNFSIQENKKKLFISLHYLIIVYKKHSG